MCNMNVKAAINAIETKIENNSSPQQLPSVVPKRNIYRQSPFRHSRRREKKLDDSMVFQPLNSPYRTRSTSCRSCSDTFSSSLNPSPKSYLSENSHIHLHSDNSHLSVREDKLSFEMQESFQNLLGGYLMERKRTMSLENELLKTKDELSSCYTKLECILKDANEDTSNSAADTSTLSSELNNLISSSPRACGGYGSPASVSCIGIISPENEGLDEKHPVRVNNEVNAYDKIVILFIIVLLIIIVGIIVDSQL